MFLWLQATPYEQGYAVGQLLGVCCCLGALALLGAGGVAGIVMLLRRGKKASGAAPPGTPPPSHYGWAPGAGTDFPAMQAKQADLLSRMAPDQLPESDAINAAAKKLVAKDFDGAIAAYDDVARRFPHRAADAHGQLGAAWFFKRDFDRAISHYRYAMELGADRSMMEDNIREAEDAKRG